MFSMPAMFQDFLSRNNYIEKIYKAMENDDYSEVVLTAMDVLQKTHQVPPFTGMTKSAINSYKYRNEGNVAYKNGDLLNALALYNKALLFAPKNSKEMVLAYSNRSQLLQCQTAYIASLADIELCLTMECKDILKKLTRRKKEIIPLAANEQFVNMGMSFTTVFFDSNIMPQNLEVSCASLQVTVDRSDNPKVVAASVINPGCVLAHERAFVSYTVRENDFLSCHFCQRMPLNLIPCDGCCHVLFCDEQCRKKCIMEYHEYECPIMDQICVILCGPSPNLMFKAALKIKSMCKSWTKLINEYKNRNTMETATVTEIFDCKNKFSILHTAFEKPFVHGILYNASFVCAAVIHYLQELTSFFPKNYDEKDEALRVFSRIMMFLSLQQIPIQIIQPSTIPKIDKSNYCTKPNFGFYSFTGKIKTSCNPNIMAINNNQNLILIAIRTINPKEELTISTLPFDSKAKRHERNFNNYFVSGMICNCNLCDETSHSWRNKTDLLSKEQKAFYSNIDFQQIDYFASSLYISSLYPVILKILDVLSDVPYSAEYINIIKYLKTCILYVECVKTKNYILPQNNN